MHLTFTFNLTPPLADAVVGMVWNKEKWHNSCAWNGAAKAPESPCQG